MSRVDHEFITTPREFERSRNTVMASPKTCARPLQVPCATKKTISHRGVQRDGSIQQYRTKSKSCGRDSGAKYGTVFPHLTWCNLPPTGVFVWDGIHGLSPSVRSVRHCAMGIKSLLWCVLVHRVVSENERPGQLRKPSPFTLSARKEAWLVLLGGGILRTQQKFPYLRVLPISGVFSPKLPLGRLSGDGSGMWYTARIVSPF